MADDNAKIGRQLAEDIHDMQKEGMDEVVRHWNDPAHRKKTVELVTSELREHAHSVDQRELVKGMVDAMLKGTGGEVKKFAGDHGKYGIPSTREEFDEYYRQAPYGAATRDMVASQSHLPQTPEFADDQATLTVASKKYLLPLISAELARRGVDAAQYEKTVARVSLDPAGIDLTTLDAKLTAEEKAYVTQQVLAARALTDVCTARRMMRRQVPNGPSAQGRTRPKKTNLALPVYDGQPTAFQP